MKKILLWTILGGMIYYTIEGLWRIPTNGGWSNVMMVLVGGTCFSMIGSINSFPKFYNLSMWKQCLIGAIIVLVVEFISGYILNIKLQMNLWDYSNIILNIKGQICLLYGILWFFLMPFAIWLEDYLNVFWCYKNKLPVQYDYTLIQAYKELIFNKM